LVELKQYLIRNNLEKNIKMKNQNYETAFVSGLSDQTFVFQKLSSCQLIVMGWNYFSGPDDIQCCGNYYIL